MTRLKPYPACKDSGVEWLGKIPARWNNRRLRFVCRVNPSKSKLGGLPRSMEVSFLPMEAIGEDGKISLEETRTLEQVWQGYTYFSDGDVVVAKITPCFENGKGALCAGLLSGIGFGTTELQVLRPGEGVYSPFIYYLTNSHPFRNLGIASMQGAAGQQRVTDEFIKDFRLSLPSFSEQQAISVFLDRETAKIDVLVAKKERLIELLQGKRAALITHAVTKGLDPTVPMKDSGVEWLGKVPAHWEVKRVRDIAKSLQTGPFGSQLHSGDYMPGGIPVINPSHLREGSIFPDVDCAVDENTWLRLRHHELYEGDIIFARRGEMGRCALVTSVEVGWLCGTGSLRIRPNLEIAHPPFLNRFLSINGVRDWLILESVGATMDNLNTAILGRIPLLIPPVHEQRAIAVFLDRETAKIDALIAKVREGIEKLKEYRTALISAAVTGKIDVRGEAVG